MSAIKIKAAVPGGIGHLHRADGLDEDLEVLVAHGLAVVLRDAGGVVPTNTNDPPGGAQPDGPLVSEELLPGACNQKTGR